MTDEARIIARERVETLLGNLLRVGVVLSLLTILTGITLLLVQNPGYFSSPPAANQVVGTGEGYPHTPLAVFEGAFRGDGSSVIMLGVFLLIATPVLRVVTSVLAFAMSRDWIFTAITASVLIVLVISFLLGRSQ